MVRSDALGDSVGVRPGVARPTAVLLALLAGAVVGGVAVVDGDVTGLARPGVVLGAALLLGSLVAVPSLLR